MRFPVTLMVSAAILAASAIVFDASAKPKKPVSMGCTADQLQTPDANACIDKMEDDILNNRAYVHFVMCDETGSYCCQGDSKRTFGCKRLRARVLGGSGIKVAPGQLTTKP
ncbi:MAG: hypothetical protein DIU65_05260 [Proteobacteria bacterium]|jgi:hypothetical protein|nr:MAG: hypothetical protein DIU65_05260 [Pseudomonadota bacterium]